MMEMYRTRKHRESLVPIQALKSYAERNRIVKEKTSGKILELGCGEFPLFKNSEKADICKIKDYHVVDCNNRMPFKGNSFDTIIALELIEHLYNPDVFLKECRRILKKNGRIILSTPNLMYWKIRICMLFGNESWMESSRNSGHLAFFTPKSLKSLLRQAGFANIVCIPIGMTKILSLCGGFVITAKKKA